MVSIFKYPLNANKVHYQNTVLAKNRNYEFLRRIM